MAMLAIFAVISGVAAADDNPPAGPTATVPTVSLPAVTTPAVTTTAPVQDPAPPTVTVPVLPAPTPPAIVPVPGTQVQAMLMKRVRGQLAGYVRLARHWQSWLGHKPMRPVNIWALGSLQRATHLLTAWKGRSYRLHRTVRTVMRRRIQTYTQQVVHMDRVMGVQPPRALASSGSLEKRYLHIRRLQRLTYLKYSQPPHLSAFLCIHSHEGAWDDRDSGHNGHYGGIQMGPHEWHRFGYLYAGIAHAYDATPLEQIWSGVHYYEVSGFNPWPQTARMCGVL